MSGKKICVYIRDDVEKDVIKNALAQYRATSKLIVAKPVLSPEQEEILSVVLKELAEIKKLLPKPQENNTMAMDFSENLQNPDEDLQNPDENLQNPDDDYMRDIGLID